MSKKKLEKSEPNEVVKKNSENDVKGLKDK